MAGGPEGALPVAVVKADNKVQLNSPEQPIKPKPGDMVIWFGPKQEKARPAKNGAVDDEKALDSDVEKI